MAVQEKLYTAEELAQMPSDSKRIELVKGELAEITPSVDDHRMLSNEIGYSATDFVKKNNIQGIVTIEGGGYILSRNPSHLNLQLKLFPLMTRQVKFSKRYWNILRQVQNLSGSSIQKPDPSRSIHQRAVIQWGLTRF